MDSLTVFGHSGLEGTPTTPPMTRFPNPQLVIFDPIFRGSRLYFSALAARAVAGRADVVVVTRRDAVTDHYRELFAGVPHRLLPAVELADGFWYGELTQVQVAQGLAAIVDQTAAAGAGALYLPGLNELMPALLPARRRYRDQLARLRPVYVEYLPDYLAWPWQRVPPSADAGRVPWPLRFARESFGRLRAVRRLLRQAPGHYLVLDERLRELPDRYYLPPWLARRLEVLCDPAPAALEPALAAAPAEVGPGSNKVRLVVTGQQSQRKGLADVVALAESPEFDRLGVEITLVGRLTADTEPLRPRLAAQPRIRWIERFVAERELAQVLASSDVALLPYTTAFTGSSGSLVRAAQAGLAIVATEHGLIGHRVQRHQLGATYRAGDLAGLIRALRVVGADGGPASPELARLRANGRRFAAANSEANHMDTLRRVLTTVRGAGA